MTRSSTIHAFFATAARLGPRPALHSLSGEVWVKTSWSDYALLVRRCARAFVALGVKPGDKIAVLGPNRQEWLVSALGALAAGAVPVGIYPTLTGEQAAYIARHADAVVAVVHGGAQLEKLRARKAALPSLRAVALMTGPGDGGEVLSFDELLARGDQVPESAIDERLAAIEPGGLCTLIYTSGTTGAPKAVMLSHDALLFVADAAARMAAIDESDSQVCYLPLSHIAEQIFSLHGPAVTGASVWMCEPIEKVADVLRTARPTIFFAVPRVWEKIQTRIEEQVAKAPRARRAIFSLARAQGLAASHARARDLPVGLGHAVARRVVFGKLHAALGLDRARFCGTGAAAMPRATLDFFDSIDLPIHDLYGMSENSGFATSNLPRGRRPGTVGRPNEGSEIRLASDGEILTRGRQVFLGYFKDAAATADVLDAEGWLRTGDVGEIDDDGFLRITDRKKDLLITSAGKNVSPQNIESQLGRIPGVAQAVVVGDARKYLGALFTLDPEAALREASARGIEATSIESLSRDPRFVAHLDEQVKKVNASLAPYETIKRFCVLPVEFSIDSGELTPTMKLKRKVVGERYRREIDELFA